MFRSFFTTIFRGSSAVLCAVTIPPADLRLLSLYYYAVCGRMCMTSVIQQYLRIISTMFMISRIWNVRHLIWRRPDLPVSACLVFLSVGDLLVNCFVILNWLRNSSQADHKQTRTPNTHRWHTHAATYCVIIRTQRTQIRGRNSNGTKHSGGPPEDGREKRPKHVGVLYLQTRF